MAGWDKLKSFKKIGTLLLKIIVSVLLLYVIFNKVANEKSLSILANTNIFAIFIAFILYNAGVSISALRSGIYLESAGIKLSLKTQLQLYFKGILYNIILPGGIGGDGYKVVILTKAFPVGTKKIITLFLTERIAGMAAICTLLGIFISIALPQYQPWNWIAGIILGFGYAVMYGIGFLPFIKLQIPILKTFWHCITNQVLQTLAFLVLIYGAGIDANLILYAALFLVSSIATAIPISVGGVGMREATFVLAASYLPIESEAGIISAFLFFLITAASAVIGLIIPSPTFTKPIIENEISESATLV